MNVKLKDSPMKDAHAFVDFPDEVWLQIFKHLSTFDLLKFQLLTKRLNNLSNQVLWHSIYVYHPSDIRAGNPWRNHTWMSMGSFLHLSRSRRLKSQFMKELIFYGDEYMSVNSLLRWQKELNKCCISCSRLTKTLVILNTFWTKVGHLYVSKRQEIKQFLSAYLIKSLRIGVVDLDFYQNYLPQFTRLESLYIDDPVSFEVKVKLSLKTLYLGNTADGWIIYKILQNFDILKLESLLIRKVPTNWNEWSQNLVSIKEIELEDTIKHLPYYSLGEVHYIKDIPYSDLEFLKYHPITYLSVGSPSNLDPSSMTVLKSIPTIRKLKLHDKAYRVECSMGDSRFTEIKTSYDFE